MKQIAEDMGKTTIGDRKRRVMLSKDNIIHDGEMCTFCLQLINYFINAVYYRPSATATTIESPMI